jgi:signal transduction histidine kinase
MTNPTTADYTILVVEDNLGDFTLIEDFIMERINFPVIDHASSFREAETLLLAAENDYNIVLLDLSLPDKNGENLIQEIIALCKNIPVVVLTGYSDFTFGVKSLNMGVADYLAKEDLNAMNLYKSIVYSTERKKISSDLEESEKQVRSFANQLNNALEEERAHIAREIHDEFGQQLTGLKMSLSALRRLKESPSAQEELINTLVEDVNVSIEMVRRIANELRPALIDKLGLPVAIEWLVTEFSKKTGVSGKVNIPSAPLILDKTVEINVFRICQEALTNIAKHAQATEVNIEIRHVKDQWTFKISDNGVGIGSQTLKNSLSMGLLNMKERSYLIGAILNVRNNSPSGTMIELTVNTDDKENFNS